MRNGQDEAQDLPRRLGVVEKTSGREEGREVVEKIIRQDGIQRVVEEIIRQEETSEAVGKIGGRGEGQEVVGKIIRQEGIQGVVEEVVTRQEEIPEVVGKGKVRGRREVPEVVEKINGRDETKEKAQEAVEQAYGQKGFQEAIRKINGHKESRAFNLIKPTKSGQRTWDDPNGLKDDKGGPIRLPCLGVGTRLGSSRWRRWEGRRRGRTGWWCEGGWG